MIYKNKRKTPTQNSTWTGISALDRSVFYIEISMGLSRGLSVEAINMKQRPTWGWGNQLNAWNSNCNKSRRDDSTLSNGSLRYFLHNWASLRDANANPLAAWNNKLQYFFLSPSLFSLKQLIRVVASSRVESAAGSIPRNRLKLSPGAAN